MPKQGIADPQGTTIRQALPALGYDGVIDVRVGKHIELTIDALDEREARTQATEICERLLANTVIEDYEVSVS
jgi:phosphoribosylformylglycinamidine synthase PurS subunit